LRAPRIDQIEKEFPSLPVNVRVRTVVVSSGTASRRAVAFWTPIASARTYAFAYVGMPVKVLAA
jgi:hypothetical protein